MELTDLCALSQWEDFENQIYNRFNLQGSVFNPEGMRITQIKNWTNDLCPAIKATPKGQSFICSVAHMNMATIAQNTRARVVEECDAGFTKIVIPIFFEDQFVGVAGACGFLDQNGEADAFAVAKITEMDENKVEALAKDIPMLSPEKIAEATAFMETEVTRILAAYNAGQLAN